MSGPDIQIDLQDQQSSLVVDIAMLRSAIEQILLDEGHPSAEISVALVDDARIHQVNREFLGHDYSTDVISFLLSTNRLEPVSQHHRINRSKCDSPAVRLEAELVVSTETAVREAAAHGWSPMDELLLYVVHGTLHLCGYDDSTDEARPIMRERERQFLARWHLVPVGLDA